MKRSISILKYSHWIVISVWLCGCQSGDASGLHWSSDNYYEQRLNNISKIPEMEAALISAPCIDVILLQSNACNECSKYKIQEILDSVHVYSRIVHFLFVADSLDLQSRNLADLLEADPENVHCLNRKTARTLGLDLSEIMRVSMCEKKVVGYHIFSGNILDENWEHHFIFQ